jgi:hypothetical protein
MLQRQEMAQDNAQYYAFVARVVISFHIMAYLV